MSDRVILHADLNNFYASVEEILNPTYVGKPLAVCGDPEKRHGIILAKNQLAKKCGVKTAETIWEAKQKCPDILLVPPHFQEYAKYSAIVVEIYKRYTDQVEAFGLDECWLDVTGSVKLFGNGKQIADRIRAEVKNETGLTISVGVSFSKTLAKLGSDLKKPDATSVISRENYKTVAWRLPASELLMVGRQTFKRLNSLGIFTIGDLANADRRLLANKFGIIADKMIDAANGDDRDEVRKFYETTQPKSVGNGTTTAQDMTCFDDAKIVIYALSESVAMRLRRHNLAANVVSIQLKTSDFKSVSRQMQLTFSTANSEDIADAALQLLKTHHNFAVPLRLITVTASGLIPSSEVQISFFDEEREKGDRLSKAIDNIRDKFGYGAVKRGVLYKNKVLDHQLDDDESYKPFKKDLTPPEEFDLDTPQTDTPPSKKKK